MIVNSDENRPGRPKRDVIQLVVIGFGYVRITVAYLSRDRYKARKRAIRRRGPEAVTGSRIRQGVDHYHGSVLSVIVKVVCNMRCCRSPWLCSILENVFAGIRRYVQINFLHHSIKLPITV